MSRENIKSFQYHERWSLISINGNGETPPDIVCPKLYSKLELFFDDIDEPVKGYRLFSDDDANQIINFVQSNKNSTTLFVIHCHAGISRSAAVAAALSRYYNGDERFYFNKFIPNIHVYSTIIKNTNKNLKQINDKKEEGISERTF